MISLANVFQKVFIKTCQSNKHITYKSKEEKSDQMRKLISARTEEVESCEKVRTELQPAGTVLPPGCAKIRHTSLLFCTCYLYLYLCVYLYLRQQPGCSTSLIVLN